MVGENLLDFRHGQIGVVAGPAGILHHGAAVDADAVDGQVGGVVLLVIILVLNTLQQKFLRKREVQV